MNFNDIINDSLFDDVLSPFLSGKRERILLGKDIKRRERFLVVVVGKRSSDRPRKRRREREREKKKEREKDEDDLMLESDAPRGKRSERADRDENEEEVGAGTTTNEKNNGKMSAVKKSNDLLDANALEHLVGACERACASPSIRTPDGAASTSSSSFDERRQRQRERTKEFCSRLKPHVARITAKEVGLATEEEEEEPKSFFTSLLNRVKKKYSRTFSSRSVYSQTVYGCENFQISTFIIPKGMEIPLHNHPAMTVFSKCLYGSAKVQTYKWKDGNYENARAHKPRACELVSDVVITALDDSVQVCSPEENIHRVVAITDLAILDVFVPPYDAGGERGCTYYELNREQKESFTLLEIVDSPFKCYPMEYKGLKI